MTLEDIVYPDQILHSSLDEDQRGYYFPPLYATDEDYVENDYDK